MPWAGGSWDGRSWAGAGQAATTGGVVLDPARPDLPGWRWKTQIGIRPWSSFAYSGGGVVARPTTG